MRTEKLAVHQKSESLLEDSKVPAQDSTPNIKVDAKSLNNTRALQAQNRQASEIQFTIENMTSRAQNLNKHTRRLNSE